MSVDGAALDVVDHAPDSLAPMRVRTRRRWRSEMSGFTGLGLAFPLIAMVGLFLIFPIVKLVQLAMGPPRGAGNFSRSLTSR